MSFASFKSVDLILIWVILMLHQGMEDDADLEGTCRFWIWEGTA